MKNNKDFSLIFLLHLIIILLAYLSPFLFNLKIIFAGVLAIFLQQLLFKGCILTHKQFGFDKNMTFYYHYLMMAGLKPNKRKLKILMTYIMPLIILIFTIILQIILKFKPILI